MKATPLRHRLKIYQQTTTQSVTGAISHDWQHTLSGQFSHVSGKDVIAGQAHDVQIIARAKIRYRTDIDHTMRVQYAGRMYEIVGEPLADNNTGREYLTLMLKGVAHAD